MYCRYIRLILPLLLLSASSAPAQTTAPATTPSAALDQTTPRGTLKLFFTADARSDGDAMRPLLAPANPAEAHMIDAMADKKNADRALTNALKAKFPDQWKTDPRQQAENELPMVYTAIDQSDQTIDHDTATLKAGGGQGPPMTLKQTDGKWRIPLAALVQVLDPNKLEKGAHQIEIQVQVMHTAAIDVSAGKYASQDLAIADIKQKMFDAALADHSAATKPAAQP
jgi:hypothetical protein